MAVAMIGPKFYAWDRNGKPLAFGKLYTYQARTNVPKDTYQSEDQVVPNTNPVILNGEGYADIYLSGSYKMVLKDDKDNEIWTSDPVSSNEASEWGNCLSATYISTSTIKVFGNFIETYKPGSRVRIDNNTSDYSYSTILSSVFASNETTITISDDVVTTGVQEICLSVVSQDSLPERNPENVELMIELDLKPGYFVKTKGYYNSGDGGQASYLISETDDDGQNLQLNNGNYAIIQINEDIDCASFGVIYGDSSDQSNLIEKANTLLSSKGYFLVISGEVKANLDITDENVKIKGAGELKPFDRAMTALKATANFNEATSVSAIVTVTQTVGARSDATVSKVTSVGHSLSVGEVVKVVSEDVIPTTVTSEGCRNGEWSTVLDVDGDDVYLDRVLEEIYTTNPRIASISDYECDIQLKVTSSTSNGSAGAALALIRGFKEPKLNLNLKENDGVGLALHGCYNATGDVYIENLTNDTGDGIFGYGVIEAGCGMTELNLYQTGFCRHVYTTGVASKTDQAIYTYGEPWAITIKGKSQGATSNAWDTHSQGNGIVFDGVEAYGVQSMFQSRSRKTRLLHPTGSDMLFFAQVRSSDTGTKADAEITGFRIDRCKKPFNLKDDSASSNEPNVVLRGDSFISYEPTSASAAIDSDANLSIYGSVRMQMLGGTDANFIAQDAGNINIYGNLILDSLNGACTKPFKLNDCNFTVHGDQGGHIQIASASIGKLFTANDAPAGSTTNVKANDIDTNIALASTDWFEFPMATEQLTIRSTASQITQSSFQFINTGGGNTDIEFNSLDHVIYLQFSTQTAPDDTITSVSDGQFPGQQLFIENANSVTLNIPNSLGNVQYTKTIAVGETDTLTWRGTYWA